MLEKQGRSEAVIIGGTTAISEFVDAGLVNDIFIVAEPVLFGGEPLPLLRGVQRDSPLKLLDSKKLNDNTLQLHDRVSG